MRAPASLMLLASAGALNNGIGRTPPMGYSSWYSVDSEVTEAHMHSMCSLLVSSGMAAAGYKYCNVDEGWLEGRYPNGTIFEDRKKFPAGMKALGDYIHSLGLLYGLYTCRGSCQCGTSTYAGPGSLGHEAADVAWIVAAGADWLKVDSCCASQDHATAFAEYALFRNALNASGRPVAFNLCGWNPWYAPPDPSLNYTGGGSLGNSWRISGDGQSWAAITTNMNTFAAVANYSAPYAWNDPDNIIGPNNFPGSGTTDAQARAHWTLWALFPAPLVIGNNLALASPYFFETVLNAELIAINQEDPLLEPAQRLVGGDVTYPCAPGPGPNGSALPLFAVQTLPCEADPASARQSWAIDAATGAVRLAGADGGGVLDIGAACAVADGTPVVVAAASAAGACGGANQRWTYEAPPAGGNGSLINAASGTCLDEFQWTTPTVDIWACDEEPGRRNEQWAHDAASGTLVSEGSGLCLTAVPAPPPPGCTNVWGRRLRGGAAAFAFFNNGPAGTNASVSCDAACLAAAGISPATAPRGVAVRDLWAHADLPPLPAPGPAGFSLTAVVCGDGAAEAFRLEPL